MALTKMTISIPSELRRRARLVAVARNESVSSVICKALTEYVNEALEEAEDVRDIREIEALIAAGKERYYSHEEVWREIEELEAQGELPD